MNKLLKIVVSILAGCNVVFSLFLPTGFALLWIIQFGFTHWGSYVVVALAILSTVYKAIDIGILEKE